MASLERRIRKSRFVQGTLSRLYTAYILFVLRTTRWRSIGTDRIEADLAAGRPHVLCCWHRQVALAPLFRKWEPDSFAVLASDHEDARLLALGYRRMGVGYIPLQTTGDNAATLRASVRAVRRGMSLGVSPDGPLGPAEIVKPGAVLIAGMARVPVTAFAYAISRKIRLRSWDGFVWPLPFGRGVFYAGESFAPAAKPDPGTLDADCARLAGF
ncbi:MAG: DUF374 domain-containing protein [Rhodobacteraceae bacterium]|nr:DUF374 domain-containing protein [Paracoccaceae bacterium]